MVIANAVFFIKGNIKESNPKADKITFTVPLLGFMYFNYTNVLKDGSLESIEVGIGIKKQELGAGYKKLLHSKKVQKK